MNAGRLPEGFLKRIKGSVTVLVREDFAHALDGLGVFESEDPNRWKGASGRLQGGRGLPVRIRYDGSPSMVVKPLLRGGTTAFLKGGLHFTMARLFQEARLSNHLEKQGVPLARMMLGRAEHRGLAFYRMHLGTEEVEHAVDLLGLLRDAEAPDVQREEAFLLAGASVRALHDAGVLHHDLNFTNLMAVRNGPGERVNLVRIIDLDRSVLLPRLSERARCGNLARLYRHAVKYGLEEVKGFKKYWRGFLAEYCRGGMDRDLLEKRIAQIFRRTLPFHRISWRIQGR